MYASGFNAQELKIRTDFDAATRRFYKNYMILMPRNVISCVLERIHQMKVFTFKNVVITKKRTIKNKKIIGVTADNKLNFKSHIKIGALPWLSNHLNDFEKKLVFNSIAKSQFTYCPLV